MQDVYSTDMIFSKLSSKLSNSSSLLHKKALSFLTSIKSELGNDALGENGGKFYLKRFTDYLNALLNKMVTSKTDEDMQSAEALIFLFSAVIKNVSVKATRKNTDIALRIVEYFLKNRLLPNSSKKYLIIILERLLSARTEIELRDVNDPVVVAFSTYFFRYIEDKEDVVHKQVIKSFSKLMKITGFAEFSKLNLLLKFENHIKVKLHGLLEDSEQLPGQEVHILSKAEGTMVIKFLASVMQFLPYEITNNLMLEITNLLESTDTTITRYALLCLEAALSGKTYDIDILEKVISALLEVNLILEDEENDEAEKQLVLFFVKSLTQCLIAISRKNLLKGFSHLTSVISILGEYITNEDGEVQSIVFNSLNSLLANILSQQNLEFIEKSYLKTNIDTAMEEDLIDNLNLGGDGGKAAQITGYIEKICTSVLYLLGDRFSDSLKLSFGVIYTFLDRIHKFEQLAYIIEKVFSIISENSTVKKSSHFKTFIGKCFNITNAKLIFNFFPIQVLDYDIASADYTENSSVWILSYIDKYLKVEKSLKEYLLSFILIIQDVERIIEKLKNNEKIEGMKLEKEVKKKDVKGGQDGKDMQLDENLDEEFNEDDQMEEDELDENFMLNKNETKYVRQLKIKRYELILLQVWKLVPNFCGYNVAEGENDDFNTYVHLFLEKIDATLNAYPQTRVPIFKALSHIIESAKKKISTDTQTIKTIKKEGKKYFIRTINWLLAANLSNEEMKEGFNLFSQFSKILPDKELYQIISKEITTLDEKIPKDNKKPASFIDNKDAFTKTKKVMLLRLSLVNYLVKHVNLTPEIAEVIQQFFQTNFFNTQLPVYLKKNLFDLFIIMIEKENDAFKILNIVDMFIKVDGLSLIPSAKQKSKLLDFIFDNILQTFAKIENKQEKIALLNKKYSNLILDLIILTKDVNRKVRNNAYEIIAKITAKLWDENLFDEWVFNLLSRLSSEDTFVVSSSINALSRVFWEKRDELVTSNNQLMNQTYHLIDEKLKEKGENKIFNDNKEVTKSIFLFLRVFIFLIQDNRVLLSIVPGILNNVFNSFTESIRNEFKVKIRNLVKNLLLKLGFDEMKKVFPSNNESLLVYINKHIVKKIKKSTSDAEGVYSGMKLDDSVMMDNDMNLLVDEEEEYIEKEFKKIEKHKKTDEEKFLENLEKFNIDENEKPTEKKKDMSKEEEEKQEKKNKFRENIQNLFEKSDVELNNFFYVNPYVQTKLKKEVDEEEKDNDVFFDKKKGKLIVKNAEEKSFISRKRHKDAAKPDDDDTDEEEKGGITKKRKVQETGGSIKVVEGASASASRETASKKNIQSHVIKFSGKEYQGKTGKGDLLLKNKPDPFAYIQLNPKATSKKRRGKAVKVFEQVMNPQRGSSLGGLKIKSHK